MKKIRVIICGHEGRMGQLLVSCAKNDAELALAGAVGAGDDLAAVIDGADVIVDFTTASATLALARIAAEHGTPLVIGTTGHSEEEKRALVEAVRNIPVVFSANFSTGVNVLFYLTEIAARAMPGASVHVSETHHTKKKDSPSGTAKRLAEILERAGAAEVPVEAARVGDVIGEHTVTLSTADEKLSLSHEALDRATFARGALRAAKWLVGRAPGLYDMQDVLGLKRSA